MAAAECRWITKGGKAICIAEGHGRHKRDMSEREVAEKKATLYAVVKWTDRQDGPPSRDGGYVVRSGLDNGSGRPTLANPYNNSSQVAVYKSEAAAQRKADSLNRG